MEEPDRSVVRNVRWGIGWGLSLAVGFSILGFIPALIRALTSSAALGGRAVSFFVIIAIYVVSGVSAGAVVGLFRPILRNPFGAALAGVVAAVPVAVAIRVGIIGAPWLVGD